MKVDESKVEAKLYYMRKTYFFCLKGWRVAFETDQRQYLEKIQIWQLSSRKEAVGMHEEKPVIREMEIKIEGMTSEEFGERVKEVISSTWGVASVEVSLLHKKIAVRYDANRTAPKQFYSAITEAGYRVLNEVEKADFWSKIKKALTDLKTDMEKNSVAHSNSKPTGCCHPPGEVFKQKRQGNTRRSSD